MKTESVVVLNGSYHNSLTIVRSLARKGISVIVGNEDRGLKARFGEAMLSRYACGRFLYPSPEKYPEDFIEKINMIARKYGAGVLLPVGVDTYVTVSAYRHRLNGDLKTIIADDDLIQKAHDKYRCLKYAEKVGIRIPRTVHLSEISKQEDLQEFGLPLVIKPRKGAAGMGVRIVYDADDVIRLRDQRSANLSGTPSAEKGFSVFDELNLLVQEFIDGPVVDACVIADNGEIKALLTQERVKTLPPRGGYGVMNRTVDIPEVRSMTEKLLTSMKWHGLAQVEFKYDTGKNEYRLMEINPKFWGTLAISVVAGVDFPYMAYQMATDIQVPSVKSFRENCVYRWVLPNEFFHVMQSDHRAQALRRYISDFFRPAYYNIDLRDPLPAVSLFLKLFNKGLI